MRKDSELRGNSEEERRIVSFSYEFAKASRGRLRWCCIFTEKNKE